MPRLPTKCTKEQVQHALNVCNSIGEAATMLGIGPRRLYEYRKKWNLRKDGGPEDTTTRINKVRTTNLIPPGVEEIPPYEVRKSVRPDGVTELTTGYGIKTVDELLKQGEMDPEEWEVRRYWMNAWPMCIEAGKVVQFHQVKAELGLRDAMDPVQVKAQVADWLASKRKARKPKAYKVSDEWALEVAIYDMHLGKWAEDPEGNINWDLEIGKEAFRNAVERTLHIAKTYRPKEIVFPIGNDWGHVDNIYGKTTRGTRVETFRSYQVVARTGIELLTWAIDAFSEYAPVKVIPVPGNHDYHSTMWMAEVMHAWYRNDPNVTVGRGAKERQYWRFGRNLVMFTHGDSVTGGKYKPNFDSLLKKFPKEAKHHYADTRFHEIHVGHKHHNGVREDTGNYIRNIASLTSFTDAYHDAAPYQTPRASEAFLWHETEGMHAWFNFPYMGVGAEYDTEVHTDWIT